MEVMHMSNEALLSAHTQQIYNSAIRPFPAAQSPQSVTRAYEARAAPKLIAQLRSTDLEIRKKALLAAAQLLGSKYSFEQSLAAGVIPALASLLRDSDTTVRERTANCLTLLARKTHGVKKVLQCGALPTLLDLLQDPNIPVRDAAYKCVLEGCHAKAMQEAIMFMNGSLVRLLAMAQEEEPCRAKQALQIVLACALGGEFSDNGLDQLLIEGEAITAMKNMLQQTRDLGMQEGAVKLLVRLCSTADSRSEAVSAGLVPLLLACMTKGSMALTLAAAEALMQITVGVKGKQAMVMSGQLGLLVELMDEAPPHLTACLVELLCNCAELPAATKELQSAVPFLEDLVAISSNVHTQQSAAQALQRLKQ